MNYAVIDVDSTSYVDAVGELAGANRAVVNAVDQLTDVLYGCGAMAGSDTGGTEWAQQYDPAAAQLVQAGCTMGDALANVANLLNGSLANHDGAEHGAMMYPGMPAAASGDTDPDHGTMSLSPPAPPSAAGGTGDQPDWWHWIASHVGGLLWPDADTGRLRKAGAAWNAAGTAIANTQYDVYAADSALYAITSPEMEDVHGACADLATHLSDLGAMYVAVGNACNDYAQHVDDKHQEIQDELVSFLEWTVAIEAAGGILSVVTVGISEAAAQAAEGAEIANAASKVIRILNELIELARTVKVAVETAIKSLGELVLKLGKFVNAKLVKALESAGEALPKTIDGVAVPRFGPASKLFGDFEPFGGLTEKEFYEKYWDPAARDGTGGWDYPPEEGFKVGSDGEPMLEPNALSPGDTIDRFGEPRGRYASPDATPYDQRAIPPDSASQPYHQYRVEKPLPSDVTQGEIAPWFEQPGGGVQYKFDKPIQWYVDHGYLKVVR
ncbi:TNT domain-containing protein [Nocardioides sp. Iso805N]|uniref:TNT domain-containing protein n=1 Tax=Nocardioides sp. Iso805N TaxID=1283287 RepID=UPI00035F5C4B|nr:TNT domain-containing protein [Nocardioides sp. Iso805N]